MVERMMRVDAAQAKLVLRTPIKFRILPIVQSRNMTGVKVAAIMNRLYEASSSSQQWRCRSKMLSEFRTNILMSELMLRTITGHILEYVVEIVV